MPLLYSSFIVLPGSPGSFRPKTGIHAEFDRRTRSCEERTGLAPQGRGSFANAVVMVSEAPPVGDVRCPTGKSRPRALRVPHNPVRPLAGHCGVLPGGTGGKIYSCCPLRKRKSRLPYHRGVQTVWPTAAWPPFHVSRRCKNRRHCSAKNWISLSMTSISSRCCSSMTRRRSSLARKISSWCCSLRETS